MGLTALRLRREGSREVAPPMPSKDKVIADLREEIVMLKRAKPDASVADSKLKKANSDLRKENKALKAKLSSVEASLAESNKLLDDLTTKS